MSTGTVAAYATRALRCGFTIATFVQPTNTPAEYFWHWQNEEFDRIVDQMAAVAPHDPQLLDHDDELLFHAR